MHFQDAFELVVGLEGRFTKDPNDKGNWTGGEIGVGELMGTKYGISAKTYGKKLRQMGTCVEALSLVDAQQIYKLDFWGRLSCDLLPSIHRAPLFSCAVNCGRKRAIKWYQEALGVEVDGLLGPITIRKAIEHPDKKQVLNDFAKLWLAHYDWLVANDKTGTQARFLKGWRNRVEETLKKNF